MDVPSRLHLAGALALLALLMTSPVLAAQTRSVLVMDLRAQGVDPDHAKLLTSEIAATLGQHAELRVLSSEDLRAAVGLEQSKQLAGCADDTSCLAQLQGSLDSELIVSGTLGTIGQQRVLSVALIDVASAKTMARESETAREVDQLREALPGLLARLFGWQGNEALSRFVLPDGQKLSFAVFDLAASGVDETVASNLTQILSVEIKRVEGTSVVSKDDIQAMLQLESNKQLLSCDDSTSCLAEIGGALGVDKLVVGQVGRLEQSFVVSLRMIDPAAARVDARVTESFRGHDDQLIGAVRHAARRMMGVHSDAVGQVAIGASRDQAELSFDGQIMGTLPMPPLQGIPPGRHSVRVRRSGYFDWTSEVYITPGEITSIWCEMEPEPSKWYQQWWVWAGTGVVLVAAVTSGVVISAQLATATSSGTVRVP